MTVRIIIKGKVQGVFFRASTKGKARDLSINGFVQNEEEDSVLIEAQGIEKDIQSLIDWCKIGPPAAQVEICEWKKIPEKNFREFIIK